MLHQNRTELPDLPLRGHLVLEWLGYLHFTAESSRAVGAISPGAPGSPGQRQLNMVRVPISVEHSYRYLIYSVTTGNYEEFEIYSGGIRSIFPHGSVILKCDVVVLIFPGLCPKKILFFILRSVFVGRRRSFITKTKKKLA
jgi:hypothetical protein